MVEELDIWSDIALSGVLTTPTGGSIVEESDSFLVRAFRRHRLSIFSWTHPGKLAYLKAPPNLWDKGNCSGAIIGFNSHNFDAMTKIIRPVRDSVFPLT